MPIYFGSNKLKELQFGGNKIKEVYYGSQLVYTAATKYFSTSGGGGAGGDSNAGGGARGQLFGTSYDNLIAEAYGADASNPKTSPDDTTAENAT